MFHYNNLFVIIYQHLLIYLYLLDLQIKHAYDFLYLNEGNNYDEYYHLLELLISYMVYLLELQMLVGFVTNFAISSSMYYSTYQIDDIYQVI